MGSDLSTFDEAAKLEALKDYAGAAGSFAVVVRGFVAVAAVVESEVAIVRRK
jgi:hypothetical protein